ncbi:MAG: DUF1549 domain-containing protein [Pirellulales bacterium]|nr:DUF1549 domain-containing protein [Pirellulales bacterium]
MSHRTPSLTGWILLQSLCCLLLCGDSQAQAEDSATPPAAAVSNVPATPPAAVAAGNASQAISYYRQIRPIFQAHCQGCHQPAKAGGKYVMTEFSQLLAGGESGSAAIVAGQPDQSALLEQITPVEGKAAMPKDRPVLSASDIELIRIWIAQGAQDDSAAYVGPRYDAEHPPVYYRPAPITTLDFSPDGSLLAVAGLYEVLLIDTASHNVVARLVGKSERIESVRFSPDGQRLAVAGGIPAEAGELQIWNVPERKQLLSIPAGFNVIYGVCWSPDGQKVSYGCGTADDNSLRAVDANTGKEILFQGAHNDWIRDTAFSTDGSHLVSVSRDMSVKLTEVATQRFVDNVTSITPGALKGGNQAVARHPRQDHIVVAGADGTPKVYRLYRETARMIGDDANLVFELFPMLGRVFSTRFSPDGRRIVCGSGLDGRGEVAVMTYEYDGDVPANIKQIMGKVPGGRNDPERQALKEYKDQGAKLLWQQKIDEAPVYSVAWHVGNQIVAAGCGDGTVRLLDANTGSPIKQFVPVAAFINPNATAVKRPAVAKRPEEPVTPRPLPDNAQVARVVVHPASIQFADRLDYAQLLVTAELATGEQLDITRLVTPVLTGNVAVVSPGGLVQPVTNGAGELQLNWQGQSVSVPIQVSGMDQHHPREFVRDVAPVLSRMGCNAGTCHGSAQGRIGFKLSLRGYDPIFDVRALTDDLAGRRANPAAPERSLFLLKATAGVPHAGGQLTREDESYHEVLLDWIRDGAKFDPAAPRVTKLELLPQNPVISRLGDQQQMVVLATYSDGRVRDVTREAFLESANTEVGTVSRMGLVTAERRGEAALLARFEGAYAATTATVMGDREGFVWVEPPTWGKIDELVARKWQRMKILPSDLAGDAEFLRRVYLDLTGLPPTAAQVREFLADTRDTRVKRDEVVDRLVGSPAYVEYWTNKWADLLQVNRKFLGPEGAKSYRRWIYEQLEKNTPYDQFVRSILTASGSNREHPAASYYKILREPTAIMENTTHLFLGVRFNCNKCHDHPFERWTQDQYFQTAAYFAQVGLDADPASKDQRIGGSDVEGAKPLYEIILDRPQGDLKHDRTGQTAAPQFPYACQHPAPSSDTRREQLSAWMTSPDNQYFARSYVNRLWGYQFGAGIMEPIDDLRAGNPPSNPELLDYLTQEFIASGFDVRHMHKLISKSRTYQLSFAANQWNEDDKLNYSHATPRRLPAEVLFDTVYSALGTKSNFPGAEPGIRAAALPDSGIELPGGFLSTFGRPVRESACECERSSGLQLGPVIALISGPTIAEAVGAIDNDMASFVKAEPDNRKLVDELFVRLLNRPATESEIAASLGLLDQIPAEHEKLLAQLAAKEAEIAPIRAQQEAARAAEIAAAKQELSAHEAEIAPRVAQQEQERATLIATNEAALKQYNDSLPAQQAAWEQGQLTGPEWFTLLPAKVTPPGGYTSVVLADRSVLSKGAGKGVTTVELATDLTGITGLRLEALSDESLPHKGPGLAADGNFVVNELELFLVGPDGATSTKVPLHNAQADFSQNGFEVAKAIDGDQNEGNGWAVHPQIGRTHWAVFALKEPLAGAGTKKLTLKITHNYSTNFLLGRFRISATTAAGTLPLGLSEELSAALRTEPAQRGPLGEQLTAMFRALDPEFQKLQQALTASQQPLPVDPKLAELRKKVESLESRQIPLDGRLKQLREDAAMSTAQLANARLAWAQDIAWALINSPAFLFNH